MLYYYKKNIYLNINIMEIKNQIGGEIKFANEVNVEGEKQPTKRHNGKRENVNEEKETKEKIGMVLKLKNQIDYCEVLTEDYKRKHEEIRKLKDYLQKIIKETPDKPLAETDILSIIKHIKDGPKIDHETIESNQNELTKLMAIQSGWKDEIRSKYKPAINKKLKTSIPFDLEGVPPVDIAGVPPGPLPVDIPGVPPGPPPVDIAEVPKGNNNNSGFIWKRLPHTMKKKYLEYKKDRAEKKEMKERQKSYENKLDRETKERNKRFKEGKETENNLRIEKELIDEIKKILLDFKYKDLKRERNSLEKLSPDSDSKKKRQVIALKKKLKQLEKRQEERSKKKRKITKKLSNKAAKKIKKEREEKELKELREKLKTASTTTKKLLEEKKKEKEKEVILLEK